MLTQRQQQQQPDVPCRTYLCGKTDAHSQHEAAQHQHGHVLCSMLKQQADSESLDGGSQHTIEAAATAAVLFTCVAKPTPTPSTRRPSTSMAMWMASVTSTVPPRKQAPPAIMVALRPKRLQVLRVAGNTCCNSTTQHTAQSHVQQEPPLAWLLEPRMLRSASPATLSCQVMRALRTHITTSATVLPAGVAAHHGCCRARQEQAGREELQHLVIELAEGVIARHMLWGKKVSQQAARQAGRQQRAAAAATGGKVQRLISAAGIINCTLLQLAAAHEC